MTRLAVPSAPVTLVVGDQLPVCTAGPMTRTDFVRYAGAGGDFNPLHHDEEYASPVVTEQKLRHGLPMEKDGRPMKDAAYCLKGTWGAELYGIDARPGEEIIIKHRYSGFKGTNLDLILRSAGLQTVILTGVATNACVESTGRDVYMHDYYLVFVSDGAATTTAAAHQATLANIDQFFGQVATSDEIEAAWAAAPARLRAVAAAR